MPPNIRNFFWLNCLSLLLGAGNAFLMYPKLVATAAAAGHGPGFIIGIQIFTMALMLFLLWLIAFKRQNWARWVWLVLFVLGSPGYIAMFKDLFGLSLSAAISLLQVGLQIVALYFVFTGNAKPWFRREPDVVDAFN